MFSTDSWERDVDLDIRFIDGSLDPNFDDINYLEELENQYRQEQPDPLLDAYYVFEPPVRKPLTSADYYQREHRFPSHGKRGRKNVRRRRQSFHDTNVSHWPF